MNGDKMWLENDTEVTTTPSVIEQCGTLTVSPELTETGRLALELSKLKTYFSAAVDLTVDQALTIDRMGSELCALRELAQSNGALAAEYLSRVVRAEQVVDRLQPSATVRALRKALGG